MKHKLLLVLLILSSFFLGRVSVLGNSIFGNKTSSSLEEMTLAPTSLNPEIERFFSESTMGMLDIELDPSYGSTIIDAMPLYSLPEKPDSDFPTGDIQSIKSFDRTLNQSDLFTIRDHMEQRIDIDGDGEKEKIVYFSTGVGSVPQMLQIVKNDRVVFEMEGSSLAVVEVYGNEGGFILTTQIWQDKNGERVRYVVDEDGIIKPLWQQRHAGISLF
jgi:hypothetical protein